MFSNFKNLASSESDHFFILTHSVADPISYDPDPSFHFEIGQDPDNILFGRLGSRNKFNFRLTIFHHRLFWEDILPVTVCKFLNGVWRLGQIHFNVKLPKKVWIRQNETDP